METRNCQSCKKEFLIEDDDRTFYEQVQVPPPTWCADCRMMRRFLFRNQRNLFRRRDDASGKEIFSSFPQEAPVKVYEREYWWSDKWDPFDYGRAYDFSRPFFEQFRELLSSVSLPSKSVVNMVDAEYCDQAGWMKNAYLCFDGDRVENSAYLVKIEGIKECLDLYEAMHDERCYESIMADDNYRLFFSMDCESCQDVWFSKDLIGCTSCFGCVNLRHKSYYIFNRPYSKEEYFEKIKQYDIGSFRVMEKLRVQSRDAWLTFPVKYMHGYQNTNVSGEHIQNSKKVHRSYSVHDGENVKYSQILWDKTADSYDFTNFGIETSRVYEAVTCGFQSYGLKFCWECWQGCRDLEYCAYCVSSSHLFGSVGLRKKEYCILNKQYTKEEYEALRERIIRQMRDMPYQDRWGRTYSYGEFFPPEFSPFAYNETMTNDFFPLRKEDAEARGFLWRNTGTKELQSTVDARNLPDHIREAPDSILQELIQCISCGHAYRIIHMELGFLREAGIPLPRRCPDCRFRARMELVNPPRFWHGKCQCAGAGDDRQIYQNASSHFHGTRHCQNEFETSYAPERPEIVYCEACYQFEVRG